MIFNIIIVSSQMGKLRPKEEPSALAKEASTIGYRTCGTHERVVPKHVGMGTAKRKQNEDAQGKQRRENMAK